MVDVGAIPLNAVDPAPDQASALGLARFLPGEFLTPGARELSSRVGVHEERRCDREHQKSDEEPVNCAKDVSVYEQRYRSPSQEEAGRADGYRKPVGERQWPRAPRYLRREYGAVLHRSMSSFQRVRGGGGPESSGPSTQGRVEDSAEHLHEAANQRDGSGQMMPLVVPRMFLTNKPRPSKGPLTWVSGGRYWV